MAENNPIISAMILAGGAVRPDEHERWIAAYERHGKQPFKAALVEVYGRTGRPVTLDMVLHRLGEVQEEAPTSPAAGDEAPQAPDMQARAATRRAVHRSLYLDALPASGASTHQLAQKFHTSCKNAYKHMNRLRDHGLVFLDRGFWFRVTTQPQEETHGDRGGHDPLPAPERGDGRADGDGADPSDDGEPEGPGGADPHGDVPAGCADQQPHRPGVPGVRGKSQRRLIRLARMALSYGWTEEADAVLGLVEDRA